MTIENKTTVEVYEDSITQLEAVMADFNTSEPVAAEAEKRIKILRNKIDRGLLDELASRTAHLRALMGDLEQVIAKAGDPVNVRGELAKVQTMVGELKTVIEEEE